MSLLLIDLDGTLREPLSGQQHFQHPQDQRIIEGADIAIRAYKDDWIIVGITNQGGVAAGHKSMQECVKEQQYTLELFPELREIYFCPDFEGRKCFRVTRHNVHNHSQTKWSGQYRKPRSGMLQLAMVRHKHTPQNSLYVGDRPEDEEAARRAGVPFQWAWDWIEQHRGFYLREIALIQEYGGQIELLYLDRYEQGEVISLLFDAAGERVAGGGDQGFFAKKALCNG